MPAENNKRGAGGHTGRLHAAQGAVSFFPFGKFAAVPFAFGAVCDILLAGTQGGLFFAASVPEHRRLFASPYVYHATEVLL